MSTLRDGIQIKTYEDLATVQHRLIVFEHGRGRIFTYGVEYGCPGMINAETGEKFFGDDIPKFIDFPLYQLRLMPWTEEDERNLDV